MLVAFVAGDMFQVFFLSRNGTTSWPKAGTYNLYLDEGRFAHIIMESLHLALDSIWESREHSEINQRTGPSLFNAPNLSY